MAIDPNQRIVHTLRDDGRQIVTVKVEGQYLGYHWGPPDVVTFGHGVTREEAVMEVAHKVRRKDRL